MVSVEIIILAAGQGTRMRSRLPKVLHPIAGKPMLRHVIDTAKEISVDKMHIVVGHGADAVKAELGDEAVSYALQEQQLGTGHAVHQAMPQVNEEAVVLIAYGDVPLVKASTLSALISACTDTTLALLTVHLSNPTGYGRIVRDSAGNISRIVEQKDASADELQITEVNTGILAVRANKLNDWLPRLSADNAQGEYYLTDIIEMAVQDNIQVVAAQPDNEWEVQGVNNRQQQNQLERIYQAQVADSLMQQGVTLADANRLDVRGELLVGQDVFIDINCVFIGTVTLGNGVHIGPNCVIENATVGSYTTIKAQSILEDCKVADHCDIGPFARLRPGTNLASLARIGNFVETKKSIIGEGSKVNHLSYIGDCEIGEQVNVGAGTITCNYDGVNKHKTVIDDGSFIGSNTALVAPVTIGKNVTIGAGSTITHDVADEQLSIARGRQTTIKGWRRPTKKS